MLHLRAVVSVHLAALDRIWLSRWRHLRAAAVREPVEVVHSWRLRHYHHLLRLELLLLPLLLLYVIAMRRLGALVAIMQRQCPPHRQ